MQDELTRITKVVGDQSQETQAEVCSESASEVIPSETSVTALPVADAKEIPSVVGLDPISENLNPTFKTFESCTDDLGKSAHSFKPSPTHLSPPEVQHVVVEHIVKSNDLSSQYHSSFKLRPFSGKVSCSNFEVDYDTWRSSVEFHLADPTISSAQLVRIIVDSLLPPAASVVKSLGPHSDPQAYLDLLDSAYAAVVDGDELFAQFLNLNQNSGEKPSSYLHRLHTVLSKVVKMKAIPSGDADKQLLKQFCRGCWNNSLISTLQLEQKKNHPPTFAEPLLLLRTEEDKQAAKVNRMKQRLGFSKPKVQSQAHNACFSDSTDSNLPGSVDAPPPPFEQIQKQIVNLQAQIAALICLKEGKADKNKATKKKNKPKEGAASEKHPLVKPVPAKRPKPWYCFRCGEDGHIANNCNDPPNPTLVSTKRKE